MIAVLDACAMIAFLTAEPGGEVVRSLLGDPNVTCYAHSVNLCEVYYGFLRTSTGPRATQAIDDLLAAGVIERGDMGRPFWSRVGRLKAVGRISIADCFYIALAQELSGQVVTSDHHEFDPLVPLGICPILFIR